MKFENLKKIAIMRTSALGDIIWTIPMIRTFKKAYPNAEITLFIDKIFAPLLVGLEGVKLEIIKKPKTFKDYLALKKQFKEMHFDLLICAQSSLRINILYSFIKADFKIGFDKKRGRDGHQFFVNQSIPFSQEHSVEGFLSFARELGIKDLVYKFDLPIHNEDLGWVDSYIKENQYLVVHPKASSPQRTWAIERYAELIDKIKDNYSYEVLLTGAPGDKEFNEAVKNACKSDVRNIAGETSLKQLGCILEAAKLVIAPDSGPTHLAQAVGTTVIGLYAALPPEYTGPFQQAENCINAYPRAVKKFLGKDISEVPWGTRVKDDHLMDLIEVDEVFSKVEEILKK